MQHNMYLDECGWTERKSERERDMRVDGNSGDSDSCGIECEIKRSITCMVIRVYETIKR